MEQTKTGSSTEAPAAGHNISGCVLPAPALPLLAFPAFKGKKGTISTGKVAGSYPFRNAQHLFGRYYFYNGIESVKRNTYGRLAQIHVL